MNGEGCGGARVQDVCGADGDERDFAEGRSGGGCAILEAGVVVVDGPAEALTSIEGDDFPSPSSALNKNFLVPL